MSADKHINPLIKDLTKDGVLDPGKISDGYHTFKELYHHRNILYVKLCKHIQMTGQYPVWRSIKQSDGKIEKGWFIMGIGTLATTQITYHLPIDLWDETMFAETLEKAPDWDNHTSNDIVKRLTELL